MKRFALSLILVFASCALTMGAGWLSGPRFGPGFGPGFAPMVRVVATADDFNWVLFDGVDDRISITSTDFPVGAASITIEMWAKPQNKTGGATLFYYGEMTGLSRVNLFVFLKKLSAEGYYTGIFSHTTEVTDLNWHHFVYRTGNTGPSPTLFVDGIAQTGAWGVMNYNRKSPAYIGYNVYEAPTYENQFLGKISRWRVYNRYLSNSEIATLATNASWTSVPYGCISQVRVGENADSFVDEASPTRIIDVVSGPLTWGTGKD